MAGASGNGFRVVCAAKPGAMYYEGFARTRGNMADGAYFRRILVHTDEYTRVSEVFPAWERKWLGKAADGERLQPGRDLVDREINARAPADSIKNATGGDPFAPGAGVVFDPADILDGRGKSVLKEDFNPETGVVLASKSAVVASRLLFSVSNAGDLAKELRRLDLSVNRTDLEKLTNLKQGESTSFSCNSVSYYATVEGNKLNVYAQSLPASGSEGVVDEKTNVAVVGSPSEWKDAAWTYYGSGETLRPGVRGDYGLYGYDDWRYGSFGYLPSSRFGVLGSAPAGGAVEEAAPSAAGGAQALAARQKP